MEITKLSFNLWNDLDRFDLGESNARPGVYLGQQATYLDKTGSAVFLQDEIPFTCFRLQAEVAIPEKVGFIGFVFGAKDSLNYELIYLGPEEIQYDPVMNGSTTWQIYNGTMYQKPLPNSTGKWLEFAIEVQPNGVAVYVGEDDIPQFVIPNLQHGEPVGKIGFWGYLPSYIRNMSIQEIQPTPIVKRVRDLKRLSSETFITEWMVSPIEENNWTKALVEENGILGFSDHLKLWVNEKEAYQGVWKWNPPESDGRIRPDFVSVPICCKSGLNTIRAEITSQEVIFGWGLAVKTGVPNLSLILD